MYSGIALVSITALIASYIWFEKSYITPKDLMPIRFVEIEGELIHVDREVIIDQLLRLKIAHKDDKDYLGFFDSDLQLLEQRLESIAWLQKAELRRVWPDKIQIKIKEQRAIAHWNEDSLINEHGEIFKPDGLSELTHLPSLNGPNEELPQMLVKFSELQKLFEQENLHLDVLNLNHRYSWSLQLKNGIQLQVGRKKLLERIERFIALYPLLQSESDLPIAKVDLRYDTGLAVTRLETSELQASL
jgi:cell division protein FtsQ